MAIINQNNYRLEISYSPELLHILKQFFASAEKRNNALEALIEGLEQNSEAKHHPLLQQLLRHWEETEVDIELVKKLLP